MTSDEAINSVLAAASVLDAAPMPDNGRQIIMNWDQAQRFGITRAKFDVLPDVGYGLKMMEGT